MIPSNNNNGNPLIMRILDSLGIAHQAAPVQHTHSQSEVDGLETALAGKASSSDMTAALAGKMDKMTVDEVPTSGSNNLVKSGGVKAALDAKYSINQVDESDEQEAHLLAIAEDDSVYFDFRLKNGNTQKEVILPISKMDNFDRAISNPDTTPTANSDKLITSGGVEAAIIPVISVSDMDNKQGADGHYVFVVSGVFEQDGAPEKRLLYINIKSLAAGIKVTQVLSGPNGYQTRSARLFSSYGNWTSYEYATKSWVDTQLAGKMNAMTVENTPTENSNNLVTSGGVAAALKGKAGATHTHIPTGIAGLVPTYIDFSGAALDLDELVDDEWGMNKVIIKNDTGNDTTFAALFYSGTDLPVHLNGNGSAAIADGYYALCTIYKIDKNMNQSDNHEHDLCYFITLDGIFDSGN